MLLGVASTDTTAEAERLAGKVARLRIFENEAGRFDRSLLDTSGDALVVSQFTLIADTAQGQLARASRCRRILSTPSRCTSTSAGSLQELGAGVSRGVFGARMDVALVERRSGDDRPRRVAMPLSAFVLVLGAAVLHALWNVLLARSADVAAATTVALGLSVVLFAPLAVATWDVAGRRGPVDRDVGGPRDRVLRVVDDRLQPLGSQPRLPGRAR